jgi:hypothetical protein
MARNDDKDENDDFASISATADRLRLKGRERSRYIDEHMRGFGYRMVPSYVKDDDDDDSGGRYRFGQRRSQSRSRRSRGDDDDDDYAF